MGMLVGYARTSTTEQVAGFEAQNRDLRAASVERVFAKQVSSGDQDTEVDLGCHKPQKQALP